MVVRPEALAALRGVEHILHAGDVGISRSSMGLREIAPVTAIPEMWMGRGLCGAACYRCGGVG